MILHITTKSEWLNAVSQKEYTTSSLHKEGFIHCSTMEQTIDTANLFFKGREDLVLICIDDKLLTSECKWESPTGTSHDPNPENLFPHVYGAINISAVLGVYDFPCGKDGKFILPSQIDKLFN